MLQRQCLNRRLPDRTALEQEVRAWVEERNRAGVQVHWRFSVNDARQTLHTVYPVPICDT